MSKPDWEDRSQGKITEAQRRFLNAVAGDIARQITWHGYKLTKDDVRHLLAAVAAGQRILPGWDYGQGPQGMIVLGKSSMSLTRAEASDAITMGVQLGDDPESQGIQACPVRWSDTVLKGMGFGEP